MRGWLVKRGTPIHDWIGDVYATREAAVGNCPSRCEIIEVELPDPPHEKTLTDRLTDIARRCEIARNQDRDLWHAFDLIEDLAMTLAEDGES